MILHVNRLLLLGSSGLIGSNLHRFFKAHGNFKILAPNRHELDLLKQDQVRDYISKTQPTHIINAAGCVGGITANKENPYQFGFENIAILNHLGLALKHHRPKLIINFGSACLYPANQAGPFKESQLFSAPYEKTNEAFAVAKYAGLRAIETLCEESSMQSLLLIPSSVYGPGDHFDSPHSHVIPALISKIVRAKLYRHNSVELLGTGSAVREFIYSEDLCTAIKMVVDLADVMPKRLNIGSGEPVTIARLAHEIASLTEFKGSLIFEGGPDGAESRLLDSTKIQRLGWGPRWDLTSGLKSMIQIYTKSLSQIADHTV